MSLRDSIRSIFETTYYRCTNNSSKHISTGTPEWDNNLFVSKSLDLAKAYGGHITVYRSKPGAKIVSETQRGFTKLKVYPRKSESTFKYYQRALFAAREQGYDIIEYLRQGDVGTIIINPDSVVQEEYVPD